MANSGGSSLIGKILFVIGVIIILIVLAFLIIRFVPSIFGGLANVGSSLGSNFGSSRNEITLNASDVNLEDGDRFIVEWQDKQANPGSYSITHECVDRDVLLDITTDVGTRRLICGNIFTLGPNAKSADLRIHLDQENSFADVPVTVQFTENGSTVPSASGSTLVTVQNGVPTTNAGDLSNATITAEEPPVVEVLDGEGSESQTTSDTQNTEDNTGNTVYINNQDNNTPTASGLSVVTAPITPVIGTGLADLAISNITGFGNQVSFTVSNIGSRNSGNWQFNYSSPTNFAQTAASPLQLSLAPGQAIRYTLTFTSKDSGNQTVVVAVDPFNVLAENSKANNIASVILSGSSFGNGTFTNFNNTFNNNNSRFGNFDEDDDADFVIEDLEVGRLSGSRFRDDDEADEGDDVAIRFTVRNRGGETTDDWRFEVKNTPYDDDEEYRSRRYNELRPGEEVEIIVEFENVDEGDYNIRVEVDSEDDTDEEKESNNDDRVRLEVDR